MSRHCQITGREPGFGRSVSHSHVRTPRRWEPNIQDRRFWVPSLGRTVRLRVSVKGLRLIDRIGIDAAVQRAIGRGERF
jgi:large subunit ribosomal protein L28